MLHMAKLCVGIRDIADLRQWQAGRLAQAGDVRHRTRNFPKRAAEIVAGGSMFWVIKGAMVVRQPILDIVEDHWEDGSRCTGLILDPGLVPVEGRLMKPFQGWRYLQPSDAPADLGAGGVAAEGELPEALRRQLLELCLL
jgi:hypothetical protein